jgi:hypothetical protein
MAEDVAEMVIPGEMSGNHDVSAPAEGESTVSIDASVPDQPPAVPGSQHLLSAVVALIAGAGLVAGAAASPTALLVGIVVVQAALIWAWVSACALPGAIGTVLLAIAASAAADVVVMVWPHGQLGSLVAVLGFVQIGAFLHQLARGVARAHIVTSLGLTEVLLIAVVALATLEPLRHSSNGRELCVAVLLAVGAGLVEGHLIDLAWTGPRFDPAVARGVPAAVVSVAVGGAITWAWLAHVRVLDHGHALLLGVGIGILTGLFAIAAAFILHNIDARSRSARWARPFVAALLPIAVLAPVAYLLVSAVQG